MKFEYNRKVLAYIYLKNAYKKLLISGKKGRGMEIMHQKLIQLDTEIKEIDSSLPSRTYPYGNYKINLLC